MPGELAAIFRSLADEAGEAAGSIATAIGRFTVATADTEDANIARTLAADADNARAINGIRTYIRGWSGSRFIEEDFTPKEEAAYDAIRASTADVPQIAANTGIPEDIIAQVKTHLFLTEHEAPIAPNQIVRGYFTPQADNAYLWNKAERGTLDPAEAKRFRGLVAHEYVESKLMASGMPYRSAHPDAWANNRALNRLHLGAHEVAPHASSGSLTHWENVGLTPPDTPLAPDLSNIDDVVDAALRGLKL